MKYDVLAALEQIPASDTTYQEWINVGMALKDAGYSCEIWDTWSQNDTRYHVGECEKKWEGFCGSDHPVTIGTVIQMARERGWNPSPNGAVFNWDDIVLDDSSALPANVPQTSRKPVDDLKRYLELLFEPDDLVSYVSGAWKGPDGKWKPSGKGSFDRTARQLIDSLNRYPDDLGATIGDWEPEAGAWIRFNPVNGQGIKNENITQFRYALVESDSMSINDQDALYRKLKLPIAVLVHSGGKSLHAIVHIDAANYSEYRARVDFLYTFLEKNGVEIDKQNRNPSRLSRMPGVTRNGNCQYIAGENIGCKNWQEWESFANGDDTPAFVTLADFKDNPPVLPEELIGGVLRCGHKMLISGPSKAGKSFLLMELCVALAEGFTWLGFPCKKGRVLYINLEIDPSSCIERFFQIYAALGIPMNHLNDIIIWNLRGHAAPLNDLVPVLIERVQNMELIAIVLDPIYKVITGDENSASEMGAFCNQFDRICVSTGCAAIYSHHHSKGAQGSKRSMDRASGSGVFARDPDALLDMIRLELPEGDGDISKDINVTAWHMEGTLREFPSFTPFNFWFEYPIHRIDDSGELDDAFTEGSFDAVRARNKKCTTPKDRRKAFDSAYQSCNLPVTIQAMAEKLGISERTVRDRLKELQGEYSCNHGVIERIAPQREKETSVSAQVS